MVSIFFTPVVGGIIAGFNEARVGLHKRASTAYRIAFYSFVVYFVVGGYLTLAFSSTHTPWSGFPLFIVVAVLVNPVFPICLMLGIPVACVLRDHHEASLLEASDTKEASPHLAYLLAVPVTASVTIIYVSLIFILDSLVV